MSQWKVGDKAWDVLNGVVTLESIDSGAQPDSETALTWQVYGEDNFWTTITGRNCSCDRFPRVIPLSEARAKDYPVPKEKKRVEVEVTWIESSFDGGMSDTLVVHPISDNYHFNGLVGKTGTLVFTWEE